MGNNNNPNTPKSPNGQQPKNGMPKIPKGGSLIAWLIIILASIALFQVFSGGGQVEDVPPSQFLADINSGSVSEVLFDHKDIVYRVGNMKRRSNIPYEDPELVRNIMAEHPEITVSSKRPSFWGSMLTYWLPFIILLFFWIIIMRRMQGGAGKAFNFGKSQAKMLIGNRSNITFKDVAGVDEAKEELEEIIEFLREPKKFQKLGGRIPKGVMLLGPPGTGKTLLAKAVAGEAQVPFFSISGSDFVEMFVGVGASRVRDLFTQGKRNAPCIIFIDELDAVGRHRGAGLGGGHDEREQTLNQLLVEMDGFEPNESVIIIAATNRPDILDPALLRPGRFDRQVVVDRPDFHGREGILKVHVQKVPIAKEVDLTVLAKSTPGFSGADLANLVNEACLIGARKGHDKVKMEDFEDAKDKVIMGKERRSLMLSEEEKRNTAFHEAGHALVAKFTPGSDPVHKITIIPRGQSLGATHLLPLDDRHTYSRTYCRAVIAHMLGGRVADELMGVGPTTGAGSDIKKATNLARRMVCEWGMSDKVGPMTIGEKEGNVFLGKEFTRHDSHSQHLSEIVDSEVKAFIQDGYDHAHGILSEHKKLLIAVAESLLQRETISGKDLDNLIREYANNNGNIEEDKHV